MGKTANYFKAREFRIPTSPQYLTEADRKSLVELIHDVSVASTEDEAVTAAKKLVNVARRNKKIDEHEALMKQIQDFLFNCVNIGETFSSFRFARYIFDEILHSQGKFPQCAINALVKRLVDEGYLKRVGTHIGSYENERGHRECRKNVLFTRIK